MLKLFEHAVDVLHLHPRTGCNAALARGLDQLGLGTFFGRHAVDDALLAANVFLGFAQIHAGRLGRELTGQFVHQARQTAHLLHLLDLRQEVVQIKAATAFDFGGQLLRRLHVHTGGNLLDQRHNVAHAQNAPGMALRIKDLQAVELFAGAGKLDRGAGDLPHRQGCATA